MSDFAPILVCAAGFVFGLGVLLAKLPSFGEEGRAIQEACARAPFLDILLAALTWVPWLIGAGLGGFAGFAAAFLGEAAGMLAWIAWHEWLHPDAARGPRIVRFLNRTVGSWRNHAALWVTVIAYPGFWIIRLLQVTAYEALIALLGFPRYRQAEWINVSRQKFGGLVGHDLLWCLYCDWMTGVYALGGEMLRNVESFWCPIRFYEGKKCENCRTDFPDIGKGWVPAGGTMQDVENLLVTKYGSGERSWFGHPERKENAAAPGKPEPPRNP